MDYYSAFILGLAGSLHCALMCGPLALAVPVAGRAAVSRSIFNAGRLATYALLGAVFGFVGRTLVFAGLQRALSIGAGAAVLMGLAASSHFALNWRVTSAMTRFKSAFGRLLKQRSLGAMFLLGGLNGFLPCGLVYVGAAIAAASGGVLSGAGVMLAFGLGTLPMLMGIGMAGIIPAMGAGLKWRRVISCCGALAGVLLIMRGLSLGIPYLSPHLSAGGDPICCSPGR
ncbi:MAG: sulfite exporter TauE/SafE family protein [Tepidisphaeraceae bacterium]